METIFNKYWLDIHIQTHSRWICSLLNKIVMHAFFKPNRNGTCSTFICRVNQLTTERLLLFLWMNWIRRESTANDAWCDEWQWMAIHTRWIESIKNTAHKKIVVERKFIARLEAVDIRWTNFRSDVDSYYCIWCYESFICAEPSHSLQFVSFLEIVRLDFQEMSIPHTV